MSGGVNDDPRKVPTPDMQPYEHVVPRAVYQLSLALHESRVACDPIEGYCRPVEHHAAAARVVEMLRDRGYAVREAA